MTGPLPILIAIVGYIVLLAVLLVATQPVRREMVRLADDLADQYGSNAERHLLKRITETAMSSRMGPMMIVASFAFIYEAVLGFNDERPAEYRRLSADPRFTRMLDRHLLSVIASNPIATVIAFLPIALGALIITLNGGPSLRQAAEQPILRAATSATA